MKSSAGAEEHWDEVYGAQSTDLGWYEPEPSTIGLVTAHSAPDDSVIDVGGGDSRLIEELLDRGYEDLTVLDLTSVALDRARSRLGSCAPRVRWIHADVTRFEPDRTWELWHDRAVFHFLVDEDQRDAYRAVLRRAVAPGGMLIVAAFGRGAPERCAGLPVVHYDADSLTAAFAPDFEPIAVDRLDPARADEGDQRPYVAGVFARVIMQPRTGT
jgi:SAM-dependent methyltransferase